MAYRVTLAAFVVLGVSAPVCAQGVRPPPGHHGVQPPTEEFQAEGTIEAIGPGRIQLLSSANPNQHWIVAILPQTKLVVTGTATADFLAARMYVRFTAEFDKHGNVKDKISQLTIFTPSQDTYLGVRPAEGGSETGAAAEQDKFGAAAGGGADGGKRHVKAGGAMPAGVYSVAGQITGVQKGTLTVAVGGAALKIEVADDAKIDVRVADYRFARQGDKISVKGKMLPGKPGLGQAAGGHVKIEAAEPFSGAKAEPGKPAPRHEPRQPKKGTRGKEPAAGRQPGNP